VIATDVIAAIPAGLRSAGPVEYLALPMKTAAEIMDADAPSVGPEDERAP